MTSPLINSSSGGSLRLDTRTSQPRSTSNRSFQDQFRDGLKGGIDAVNTTFSSVSRGVPGSAMLSSSLSDTARNLGGPSGLTPLGESTKDTIALESGESIEDQMVKKNHTYLEQQMRISQATTAYTTKSNIIKALFDSLKTIGSNIR